MLAVGALGTIALVAGSACQPVDSNPNDVVLGVSWVCNADHGATYTWALTNHTSWPVHVDNAAFTPQTAPTPAFAPDPIKPGLKGTAVEITPGTNPSADVHVSFTLVGSPTPPLTTTEGITRSPADTGAAASSSAGGVHGTTKYAIVISQTTGCVASGPAPTLS